MRRRKDDQILSKEPLPHLVIVNEDVWNRVQDLRKGRNPQNTVKEDVHRSIRSTKGSLLFIGMIRCGHCGNPLTTTWNKKRYKRKDGTKKEVRSAKYRCSGKALMKVNCSGQTIYSQQIIEDAVLDFVYRYLDRLQTADLEREIQLLRQQNFEEDRKEAARLKLQLSKDREQLEKLKDEVIRVLDGQSRFSAEILNELIDKQKAKVAETESKINRLEADLAKREMELEHMESVQQAIPTWRAVFESASIEKKKMMLRTIIEQITVYRDQIDVKFKLQMQRFLETLG